MRPLKNVTILSGVVVTTQSKAWMDEDRILEWIMKVWLPYVQGKPALLSLDTFSGHLTKVKAAFAKCGTKLSVIPGGCTSILQPLDVSINKSFKGYLRQLWCQYMVDEAEKGVTIIRPVCKSKLLDWISKAVSLLDTKLNIIEKSFYVTGIVIASEERNVRDDETYIKIQEVMKDVFRSKHIGYVSDINSESNDSEDTFTMDSSNELNEDPFVSETDAAK